MKKKLLTISLTTLAFLLACCHRSNSNSSKEDIPTYDDFPDTYIDALPSDHADGAIFQAFCWSFNDIKENLQYFADSGFKVVQTSPVQQPKGGGGSWWSYYQPLSFSIADNSQLGSKEELKSLCEVAEEYDISIICDIVFNHLANISDDDLESDGTPMVSPAVEAYEPEIYQNRNADVTGIGVTFHHNKKASGSGAETQYYSYGALPDLNTGNEFVQSRCLSLLKECIDVGVDGFRFDAAKHIETPDDPDYASDFWPNTLGVAKEYYKSKTGRDLLAYGEILGTPLNRSIDAYTKYMKVTEGSYSSVVYSAMTNKKAEKIQSAKYGQSTDASNIVSWVESHDDYASLGGVDSGSPVSDKKINRLWGALAVRKDVQPMFLGRPALADESNTQSVNIGQIGSYHFEDEHIATVNRFRNRFIDAEEAIYGQNNILVVERYDDDDCGAVIENYDLKNLKQEVPLPHLVNGNYYDAITGNKVVVHEGKATIDFEAIGLAVLTKQKTAARPYFAFSERSGVYAGNKSIEVSVTNAEEAYYQIDNGEKISFADKVTINLPKEGGKTYKLTITAKNGDYIVSRNGYYQCVQLVPGYFNVINFKESYFTDYDVYIWHWNPGTWDKVDATSMQDGVLLLNVDTNWVGFLFSLFQKGYVPTDNTAFSDSHFVKQTSDINPKDGYYDASNF